MEGLNSMKFSEELFDEVKEIWDEYLKHPFVKGIGEGTLDKEKFKNYLIQDYLYLKDYAKKYTILNNKIKVEEISDYHIYPIADNDTPQLSADRLEYTLSNGLGVRMKLWNLDEVREIYQNIEVQKNKETSKGLAINIYIKF